MRLFNKRFAFTLSEVMLTIALIGFIATMTLSTIGASVQQRARLAEFRSAYSRMEAALKSVTIDEGRIFNCYECPSATDKTDFGLNMDGGCTATGSQCKELKDVFVRAMGATRFCENNPITEGCLPDNYPKATGCFTNYGNGTHAYVLDNSMILFDNGGKYMREFAVDVNGRKGPNRWGQDIFTFAVKASESKSVLGKNYVTNLSILPPTTCLPGKSAEARKSATKSSDQLLKESTNFDN